MEAAANAISQSSGMRFDGFWSRVEDLEPEDREYALTEARAALAAAAPHIAAAALEDAAEWLKVPSARRGGFVADWLRTKADVYRKGGK